MMDSFDRQLRHNDYGQFILTGDSFAQVREVLKCRQKQLRVECQTNLTLFPQRRSTFYGKLVKWAVAHQTNWFYTTVHIGLRGYTEHREMCWGDIALKGDENDHEFLEFTKRQTKTRTGEDIRNVRAI